MQPSWLLSRFLLTQKDVPSLRFAQTAMQLMRMLCRQIIDSEGKMKLPSDYKILNAIFKEYKSSFGEYDRDNSIRKVKNYVPIDIAKIARQLKTDPDIVFGRLYYHLDKIYGYKQENDSKVPFFTITLEKGKKCINFSLMTSVLAGLSEKRDESIWTRILSIVAILLSVISIIVSIFLVVLTQ